VRLRPEAVSGELVILDYATPDSNGDDVAAMMKRIKPDVRILMFSGVPDVPERPRVHVDAFLQEGESPMVVLDKIHELLESTNQAA
jgi:response regulator RpfG family c-di-GMP phosphodiesterase